MTRQVTEDTYLGWLHGFSSCALLVSGLFRGLAGLELSQEWQKKQGALIFNS